MKEWENSNPISFNAIPVHKLRINWSRISRNKKGEKFIENFSSDRSQRDSFICIRILMKDLNWEFLNDCSEHRYPLEKFKPEIFRPFSLKTKKIFLD